MKILVTGTPGSGKTSLVAHAANLNDKRFVDADEISALCEWREFSSNNVVGLVSETTIVSNDDWYKKHGWYWRIDHLQQLLRDQPDIILCGSSENVADCYKLFDRIVVMRKTKAELLSNFQSPERLNPFGKTTKQRAGFMEWQDYLIKEAQPYNPVLIDGNTTSDTYQKVLDVIANK